MTRLSLLNIGAGLVLTFSITPKLSGQLREPPTSRAPNLSKIFSSQIAPLLQIYVPATTSKSSLIVRVYYATNRKPPDFRTPSKAYGGEPQEHLTYGYGDVSVPVDRDKGSLSSRSWTWWHFWEQREAHWVTLKRISPYKDA